MNSSRDYAHLLRLAAVFAFGLLAFIVVRAAVIPKSFGQYGHYRGDALKEISSRPIAYAGHETCEACHPEVLDIKSKGPHAKVNCESCHGPLAKHAEDPGAVKPTLPEVATLCVRCHSVNSAKPHGFPQVNPVDHAGEVPCNTCHVPHNPKIQAEEPAKKGGHK